MTERPLGFAFSLLVLLGSVPVAGSVPLSPVNGVVRHLQSPVAGALVLAYGISDASLSRVTTGNDGSFNFTPVPPGVYDLVAYKNGFYPSLMRLWHQAGTNSTVVAIDLLPLMSRSAATAPADIWSLRAGMPADVLRELTRAQADLDRPPSAVALSLGRVIQGDFTQLSGFGGTSKLSRSQLGMAGSTPGAIQYGLQAAYENSTSNSGSPFTAGQRREGTLTAASSPDSAVAVTFARDDLSNSTFNPDPRMEREGVRWASKFDEGDQLEVSVARRADLGFDRATGVLDLGVPGSSTTYDVAAQWNRDRDSSHSQVTARWRTFDSSGQSASSSLQAVRESEGRLSASSSLSATDWLELGGSVLARSSTYGGAIAPGAFLEVRIDPSVRLMLFAESNLPGQSGGGPSAPVLWGRSAEDLSVKNRQEARLLLGNDASGHFEFAYENARSAEASRLDFDRDAVLHFGSFYLFEGNRFERISAKAAGRILDWLDATVRADSGRISGGISDSERFSISRADGRIFDGTASITFRPTRTELACEARRVRQMLSGTSSTIDNSSDNLKLSVGQDLTILGVDPFGSSWRLTVSYEKTSATVLPDTGSEESVQLDRRFLGGLTISF